MSKKLVHFNCQCDNCDIDPIIGSRYKSKNLNDYNLCQKCYDNREDELGMGKHPFELITKIEARIGKDRNKDNNSDSDSDSDEPDSPIIVNKVVYVNKPIVVQKPIYVNVTQPNIYVPKFQSQHVGYHCNNCGIKPIIGTRYKCSNSLGCNLCASCFNKRKDIGMYWGYKYFEYKKVGIMGRVINAPYDGRRMKMGEICVAK